MQVKLEPGKHLEQLFQGANPARQRDKGVGQLGHLLLPRVHRIHGDELRHPLMPQFARHHPVRDHANDLAARRQRRIGQDAHQPDISAAINNRHSPRRQGRAAMPGCGGIFRPRPGTRAAIDTDSPHPGGKDCPSNTHPSAHPAPPPISAAARSGSLPIAVSGAVFSPGKRAAFRTCSCGKRPKPGRRDSLPGRSSGGRPAARFRWCSRR